MIDMLVHIVVVDVATGRVPCLGKAAPWASSNMAATELQPLWWRPTTSTSAAAAALPLPVPPLYFHYI